MRYVTAIILLRKKSCVFFQILTPLVFFFLVSSVAACAPKSDNLEQCYDKNFAMQSHILNKDGEEASTMKPISETAKQIIATARRTFDLTKLAQRTLQSMGHQVNNTKEFFIQTSNNFISTIEQSNKTTFQTSKNTTIQRITDATLLLNPITFKSINETINSINDVVQPFQALLPRSSGIVRTLTESVQNITRTFKSLSDLYPFKSSFNQVNVDFLNPVIRYLGAMMRFVHPTAMSLVAINKLLDSHIQSFYSDKEIDKMPIYEINWNEFL